MLYGPQGLFPNFKHESTYEFPRGGRLLSSPLSVDNPFHTNDLRKEFHVTKPKKCFLCIYFLGLYILNIYLCMFYCTTAAILLNLF